MKPTWLQTAEPAPTGSGRSIALDSAGSSAIFFYARIPAGPGRGEGAGGAGAIAHIKSSSRRGAINAHVPKTHVVTPITDDHSCTTRNAPVRGRAPQTASCGRGILPLAAEGQREALEAMTGGAVAREVATPPGGPQMGLQERSELVPARHQGPRFLSPVRLATHQGPYPWGIRALMLLRT